VVQRSKPSRKERRLQRQRSQRAQTHGLPARAVSLSVNQREKGRFLPGGPAARVRTDEVPSDRSLDRSSQAERSLLPSIWQRIQRAPTAGKLAVLAVGGVIVLAIVAGQRDREREDEGRAPAASVSRAGEETWPTSSSMASASSSAESVSETRAESTPHAGARARPPLPSAQVSKHLGAPLSRRPVRGPLTETEPSMLPSRPRSEASRPPLIPATAPSGETPH
jgi:hypothetical protein